MSQEADLYILQGTREWIFLYPLISVQGCPSCNQKESYVIDAQQASEISSVLTNRSPSRSARVVLAVGMTKSCKSMS